MANENELTDARRRHAERLVAAGAQPFPNDFCASTAELAARRTFVHLATGPETAREALPTEDTVAADATDVPLWGRVIAKRGPFLVIRTPDGDAQALVRKEQLAGGEAVALSTLDLADHVLVRGPAIQTRTGAASVRASTFRILAKALLPPPAKWHGLKDVEKRYRERYVDLFVNEQVAEVFRARSTIVQALRAFLDCRGFLEVETPLLHAVRGGATAKPFHTHHNALDLALFLRIAPELYLKRLLVGGFERVYEIGRCFRNEGISTRHNPEFTMLEFYVAYADHRALMELTEALLIAVDAAFTEKHPALAADRSFSLTRPFARVSMRDAIVAATSSLAPHPLNDRFGGPIDRETLDDDSALEARIQAALPRLDSATSAGFSACRGHGERVFALFELLAEPRLVDLYRTEDGTRSVPVFVHEFPRSVSPLARSSDAEPDWVDRFELFVDGRELANAFSELNDSDEQAARFLAQLDKRAHGDDEAMDFDADYVRALRHGMPPAAGFGLGVDRLVMLLAGQPSIRDVLLFPLLRPDPGGTTAKEARTETTNDTSASQDKASR